MKFVVVKIVRETRPDVLAQGITMRYPANYNAVEIQVATRGPHVYDGGIQAFQGDSEELLLILPDEMADRLVAAEPSGFRKLTVAEAAEWTAKNRALQAQPDESVDDNGANRLLLVIARALATMAPQALTPEDHAAMDPNHPMPGARRSRKRLGDFFPHHVSLSKDTAKE